jgi:hypothetical protein
MFEIVSGEALRIRLNTQRASGRRRADPLPILVFEPFEERECRRPRRGEALKIRIGVFSRWRGCETHLIVQRGVKHRPFLSSHPHESREDEITFPEQQMIDNLPR